MPSKRRAVRSSSNQDKPCMLSRKVRRAHTSGQLLELLEPRYLMAGLEADWASLGPAVPGVLSVQPTEPSAGSGAVALSAGSGSVDSSGPIGVPPSPLAPSLGTSFDTINMVTNASNNSGFLFIPPDPIGAAGPSHVVNVVNVSIQWHTKAGVTQNSQSLNSFFSPVSAVNFTFDPKVIYDQEAGRFVVVTLERQDTANGDPSNTSRILVAVSDDSDPNGTWYYHAINSKLNIGGVDRWADYPGLAIDEDAIYITNNMFGFGGGSYGGTRLWIIHKGAGSGGLYDGGAATVSVHDPVAADVTATAVATTTQPAHVFGAPAGFGTFLVQHSGISDGLNEYVAVIRIDDPLGLGAGPTFTNQFVNVGNIDNDPFGTLPDAPQLGSATAIEVNDRRALHSVWRNNSLPLTATMLPNAGPDTGQTTAHWFQIDTTTLAALSLTDQGNVGGEDIAAGTYTFFPSIAVDGSDNVAIGFAASAATIYPGAYYTGRLATDTAGTVQATGVLRAGLDYYVRTFGLPRNRWGDYSGISVDPSDDATFWVFNEYAMSRGTPTGLEDGRWATAFGSFTFGLPSTVTGRHLFYNRSSFDGNNASINTSDDLAIAIDKTAYLPGDGLAVFGNVSSYSRGINGIMIDLNGLGNHSSISLSTIANDFVFKVGNNNTPSSWAAAPTPNAVSVRTNFDGSGTDRIEITWTDGDIKNQWLEVQVLPTANTGLTSTDVFFWGNKIGDIGSPTATSFSTTAAGDAGPIVSGGLGPAGGITNVRDIDRSNVITAAGDRGAATSNIGAIVRIDIPSGGPFAPVGGGNGNGGGDAGIASALAGAGAGAPAVRSLPVSVVHRLAGPNSAGARIASDYFAQLASDDRGSSLGTDGEADDLDELLDALVAELGGV